MNLSYIYTYNTKYLHLGEYILSTSKLNRIAYFKCKIALKHNLQSSYFSEPNHDSDFSLYFLKVTLSLVFGLKQIIKTKTNLFVLFLFSQYSISTFLFKTRNQQELHKSLKIYSKGDFFTNL